MLFYLVCLSNWRTEMREHLEVFKLISESEQWTQLSSQLVICSLVTRIQTLKIREFSFHQVNANLLWPGTCIFAEWLIKHSTLLSGRRILELGSGTGALTIFLRKTYDLDITTSDYDDEDIERNIHCNHRANDVSVSPHIRHTWGDKFPIECPDWDLIIASDILLYVKQYANLVKTLVFLLQTWKPKAVGVEDLSPDSSGTTDGVPHARHHLDLNLGEEMLNDRRNNVTNVPLFLPKPCFLMSWRRRIPKDDEDQFFHGCRAAGLCVADYGARVYCIYPRHEVE
nr:protein N-terminal and lysine N-methyltransferase EFM7-like isoform X1 [Physcomitrium patens]|eukprot:XP_024399928.1 protein N-terminal and lysine N-methyltransferase EFM7-like isoform X1 [Physcomitrella patens]